MSFTGSIFGNIIEWFFGRASDRRQYKRRIGPFHISYRPDPGDAENLKPGVGLAISANGLMFIVPEPIAETECSVVVRLPEQAIPLRIKLVRADEVQHDGKMWHGYMGEFLGIAAEYWDAIARYVNDEPAPDRRKTHEAEPSDMLDDAYRLLPIELQKSIIDLLVSQNKLELPKSGQTPLLKLFYGGLAKQPGAKLAHRFNAHTRIKKGGTLIAYDTRLLINDDGTITVP